jgi:hypothetical protein
VVRRAKVSGLGDATKFETSVRESARPMGGHDRRTLSSLAFPVCCEPVRQPDHDME